MLQVLEIPVGELRTDPNQPRTNWSEADEAELLANMNAVDQLVPLIVTAAVDGYMIVDGERRYRAAVKGQWKSLKAIVLDRKPDEAELLLLQLTVNCMRVDLSPLERAVSFQKLMAAKGLSASDLAKRLGIAKATVTRYLSHNDAPDEIKSLLSSGVISSPMAYALSRMGADERADALTKLPKLNREVLERKARKKRTTDPSKPKLRSVRYELPDCTLQLRTTKAMSVDGLIDALTDLLRACRKAKSQKLELQTMALVIRDTTRNVAADSEASS